MRTSTMVTVVTLLLTVLSSIYPSPSNADEIRFLTNPCRVVDTRNTSVGQTANMIFFVRGLPGAVQGGDPGCGLNLAATGVILNLIAVSPSNTGHAILSAQGSPIPGVSSINFSFGTNINNGLLVRLPSTGLVSDLVLTSSAASYWIVDLVGWTEPSVSTLVGQAESYTGADLHIRTFSGQLITARPPLVPGFYNSWSSSIGATIGKCVNISGFWTSPTVFEARSLPMSTVGYCGPN